MERNIESESEITLDTLTACLWFSRYLIILITILSLPLSFYYINSAGKKFTAKAVVEFNSSTNNQTNSSIPGQTSIPIDFFQSFSQLRPTVDMAPKLLGNEFLKLFLEKNQSIKERIQEKCTYSKPGIFSFSGLLDAVGAFKLSEPTIEQKNNLLIACLKNIIDVSEFNLKDMKTNSIVLSATTDNAFFSAKLVNEFIEEFFEDDYRNKRLEFEKIVMYLSDLIAKAQFDIFKAERDLNQFMLKNKEFVGILSDSQEKELIRGSVIPKKIKSLSEFQSLDASLRMMTAELEKTNFQSTKSISDFLAKNGTVSVLSNSFIQTLETLSASTDLDKARDSTIKQERLDELARLRDLTKKNYNLLASKEKEIEYLMSIESRLNKLKAEVTKKSIYFDSLKDVLTQKNVEKGMSLLSTNSLYSKALPPIYPSHPKKKEIFVIFFGLFFFIGCMIAFLRIYISRPILTLSQLREFSATHNKFRLSFKKHFKKDSIVDLESSGTMPLSIDFVSSISKKGHSICFIDISEPRKQSPEMIDKISSYFARLSVSGGLKCLLLTEQLSNGHQYSLTGQKNVHSSKDIISTDALTTNGLETDTLSKFIDNKSSFVGMFKDTKHFDKVFVSIGNNFNQLQKFNVIRNTDFCILVGKTGTFSLESLNKYIFNQVGEEAKCLGVFLVDY